jgi:hypothetical protein
MRKFFSKDCLALIERPRAELKLPNMRLQRGKPGIGAGSEARNGAGVSITY